MPGKRMPVAVLEANGKKHMTKAEKAQREKVEVKQNADGVKFVRAPQWLPEHLREEFNNLRAKLVALRIFDEVDRDTLGRYLVAQCQYTTTMLRARDALDTEDVELASQWGKEQERYFKQCRNCANDLGMTITSRCRLVVPQAATPAADNPFLTLLEARHA